MAKLKVGILISGRGSNMQALARAALDPDFPVEIALVLSNRPRVPGVEWAMENAMTVRVVDHDEYDDRASHEEAMTGALEEAGVELVCLAGYMRILTETFVKKWRGQILNIHPALLPAFRGVDTHARALERGVRVHGCTVHFVSQELDGGPIVAQAVVPVLPGDTEEALSGRVLDMEHRLYPHALQLIADRKVRWSGDDVVVDNGATSEDVLLFA